MVELNQSGSDVAERVDSRRPLAPLRSFDYSKGDRAKYATLGLIASAGLITARLLQPSPHGVGTHEQLGLPPCVFLHLTGIPCPGCGLTTSFAHAARLQFYESVITQPFGLVVFIIAVLSVPLSMHFTRRRVPWSKFNLLRGRNLVIRLTIALFILSWLYKIAVMKGLFWPN
jgi:uncharacterized membrane protein